MKKFSKQIDSPNNKGLVTLSFNLYNYGYAIPEIELDNLFTKLFRVNANARPFKLNHFPKMVPIIY